MEDEPDVLAPEPRQLVVVIGGRSVIEDRTFPDVGTSSREDVQQGRLSRCWTGQDHHQLAR